MRPASRTPRIPSPGPGPDRARRSLSSARAAAEEHDRLLTAMAGTIAERGYASTTVAEVITRAGLSRHAFHQHFADKRACFLAAYDAIVADWLDSIATAYGSGGDPLARAQAGLRAVFEAASANPAGLRLVTIEIAGAGAAGIARREKLIGSFEALLRENLALAPRRQSTIANPVLRALVGGLSRVLHTHVQSARSAELPELIGDLVRWTTSYTAHPAMINLRDPEPNSPATFEGLWGGRAPGTLWLGPPGGGTREVASGHRGVSRSLAVHTQRERIIDAVTNLSAERGYAATALGDITKEAGVSLSTFYQQFSGKEDAFLVAYELGHAKGLAIVEGAFFTEADWRYGVRAGLSALFDFLASEPSFAHMALVEALIATRRSAERSNRGVSAYTQMLVPGLQEAEDGSRPPPVTVEAVTGGVFELCLSYALRGRIGELSELVPRATYFALTPFIGADEAARIATEGASQRSQEAPAAPGRHGRRGQGQATAPVIEPRRTARGRVDRPPGPFLT
ncbi:MAG: TetR/AcrR family transcriptional regulator [Actinobacteria bacterium]|nr:MAG: TetR/AcrR family transcriptional regulator [Actinomycetota bacterium]